MGILIVGLVIFLGMHSIRLVAEPWRNAQVERLGERPWKGIYSLVSAAGLALIIWGYAVARREPTLLWVPPVGAQHLTALLVLIAFVLLAAADVKGNRIKRWVGHPMTAGVAIWAIGHLLANGTAHDVLLFGAFLVWSVASFLVWRRRDRIAGTQYPAGTAGRDVVTVVAGIAAFVVFALFLHGWLIGVRPFG